MSQTEQTPTNESRWQRALHAESFDGLSNALFGDVVDRFEGLFSDLEDHLEQANISTLFRTYVSRLLMITSIIFLASIEIVGVVVYRLDISIITSFVLGIAVPVILTVLVFTGVYYYPARRAAARADQMENNLPFALNQMSAVAVAGSSPSDMFKLLQNFEDYGEIAAEAGKINRKVEIFGQDVTSAMKDVAKETPSETFRQILYGLVATIETGGDLKKFLDEHADTALFDYKLRRKEQIEKLTTYASFYTALLVAAPLFLVIILSVMNLIGGSLLEFSIGTLLQIGVYGVIPALNLLFIVMLKFTASDF